jgi:ParB family chromosome partitioning protein
MSDLKRSALGRGLESLLPSRGSVAVAVPPAAPRAEGEAVQEIPVEKIDRNPYQTRMHIDEIALAELAASIKANGVVQPVVVREAGDRFQLIAGERRWLASQKAGKPTVPAIVKRVSNAQAMEMTIIENLQREDLNAMEQARAFERLAREFGLTQEQMAQHTGKDRTTISNYLRLLKLPAGVQLNLERGALTFGHARALMALDSEEEILTYMRMAIDGNFSVRQLEQQIEFRKADTTKPEPTVKAVDPNVRAAQQELERALGVRVEIRDSKGKGKIVIRYDSLEDFDRVVAALGDGR